MNFNELLDEDYRYKWHVLQILELKRESFLTVGSLMDIVGLSRYRTEKYLNEIVIDASVNHIDIEVNIEPDGEVQSKGLSNLVLKNIRLYYLENSVCYKIFKEIFFGTSNIDSLVDKVFISRSKVYEKVKIINRMLTEANIKIKNNKLLGEELYIRGIFLSLYMDFYSGIKLPFNSELKKEIGRVKHIFAVNEDISFTKTQEFRFSIFVGISIIRSGNSSRLKPVPVTIQEKDLNP
ncbi:hypothetical protein UP07_15695, partial [Listeria monocytogenes]|nr:hypothetical protein [Listeria monocytogenes]